VGVIEEWGTLEKKIHPLSEVLTPSSSLLFGLYQKLPSAQVQGSRNSLEVVEGNVGFAPLDRSHISAVNAAFVGE